MSGLIDLAIVGCGPAGMSAAVAAAEAGLAVVLLDDQPAPGGQIWRGVEAVAERGDLAIFGADHAKGLAAVARFRAAAVDYRPMARVVGIEDAPDGDGGEIMYVAAGAAYRLAARRVIIATGAYERPTPFTGWTLPGVMSLGAAQIALKMGDLTPEPPFVLAGQGPLLLLLAAQLAAAGAAPSLVLRLDDPSARRRALWSGLAAAVLAPGALAKGARWLAGLTGAVGNVTAIEAEGDGRLERVRWRTANGEAGVAEAACLLVHDGVIPNAQLTRAMRLPHCFDVGAYAWRPDAARGTGLIMERRWAHVAGDCAGVKGWAAAAAMGRLAGAGAARSLGKRSPPSLSGFISLMRARALRPFLDRLYPPARAFRRPEDATLICRCEDVSAGEVRSAIALGAQGPNQLKAFTRAGMGACQGRMCASIVANVIADARGQTAQEIGLMRVRTPIFPITLEEMAGLNETPMTLPRS